MPNRTATSTYWTNARKARLVMWYKRLHGKRGSYSKIASHFGGKTTDAVYSKLGRLGVIGANWSRKLG